MNFGPSKWGPIFIHKIYGKMLKVVLAFQKTPLCFQKIQRRPSKRNNKRTLKPYSACSKLWQTICFHELWPHNPPKKHKTYYRRSFKERSRYDFKNLKMKDNETAKDYYSRIEEIVNKIGAYGEIIYDKKIF